MNRQTHEAPPLRRAVTFESAETSAVQALEDAAAAQAWKRNAVCATRDPEVFYPDNGQSAEPAKRICATCPVTAECLAYALDNGERFGVWGGLSERERRRLNRGEVAA